MIVFSPNRLRHFEWVGIRIGFSVYATGQTILGIYSNSSTVFRNALHCISLKICTSADFCRLNFHKLIFFVIMPNFVLTCIGMQSLYNRKVDISE